MSAIIFDFDGVLLDTLDALKQLYFRILSSYGSHGTEDEFKFLNGARLPEIVCHLIKQHGLKCSEQELLIQYQQEIENLYCALFVHPAMGKVVCLLFARGYKLGLASSCPARQIEQVLQNSQLLKYFHTILGGDQVKEGKPQPDLFLCCLAEMGESTALVIEDADAGVEAAIAAGCRVMRWDLASLRKPELMCETIKEFADSHYSYLGIWPDCQIDITGTHAYDSDGMESEWQELMQTNSNLFNGPVLILEQLELRRHVSLKVQQSDYRYWLLSSERPIIVGVMGVVVNEDDLVLLGKRAQWVGQHPGLWEFVPAGTLTEADPMGQLNLEWLEETGQKTLPDWQWKCALIMDHEDKVLVIVHLGRVGGLILESLKSNEFDMYAWFDMNTDQLGPMLVETLTRLRMADTDLGFPGV